jgi:D-tyrosyl-tRNA(Tyr) deacylase
MRCVLQKVSRAEVRVDGQVVGAIGLGILAFVGVERGDGRHEASRLAEKLATVRLFADSAGRMNLAAGEVGAEFLLVSQFTVAGDPLRKGRRPSFDDAMAPGEAAPLFDGLVEALRSKGFAVATGRFGEDMEVELINAGPVTFVVDCRPAGLPAS